MRIILQAGHYGRTTGATGAPGEAAFNWDVANKVADVIRARGVEVRVVGADPKASDISGDWNLFLAIHYDADVYGTGGFFADFPEPSTDGSTKESQRICKILTNKYAEMTGIANFPGRSNKNTRFYYMWSQVSLKTPCVLIECGVGQHRPDDYNVLFNQRDKVVKGISEGVLEALGVPVGSENPCDLTDDEKNMLNFLREQGANEGKLREAFGALADQANLQKKINDLELNQKDLLQRVADLESQIAQNQSSITNGTQNIEVLTETVQKLSADVEYYKPYKSRYENALQNTIDKFTPKQLLSMAWKKIWEARKLSNKK